MSIKNIKIKIDEYEYRLLVNLVNNYRTKQLREGKCADFANEVLEKLLRK